MIFLPCAQLTVPHQTSCSRLSCRWSATTSARRPTGGASWPRTRWSVPEVTASLQGVMWVDPKNGSCDLAPEPFAVIVTLSSRVPCLILKHAERILERNPRNSPTHTLACSLCLCVLPHAGRLWRPPELPECRRLLGRPRRGELRFRSGLQRPPEAHSLHTSQLLHQLDEHRELQLPSHNDMQEP